MPLEARDRQVQRGIEVPPIVETGQTIMDGQGGHFLEEMCVGEGERRLGAEQGDHLPLRLAEGRSGADAADGDDTQHTVFVDERDGDPGH